MSNDKETAVDFLMDKLFDPSMMVDEQLKWFNQAKEIEKQQIMEAHYAPKYGCFSEDYYEQTYGGNK